YSSNKIEPFTSLATRVNVPNLVSLFTNKLPTRPQKSTKISNGSSYRKMDRLRIDRTMARKAAERREELAMCRGMRVLVRETRVIFALFLLIGWAQAQEGNTYREQYSMGESLRKAGQWADALTAY